MDEIACFDRHCSPGIYLRHVHHWATAQDRPFPLRAILAEKQAGTFGKLITAMDSYLLSREWQKISDATWWLNGSTVEARHQDACEIQAPGRFSSQAAHVYCDPNHIEDWALTPEFLAECPKFTTSVTTLGCNVGGLKRIPLGSREAWYERVDTITSFIIQGWHDACLFSVGGPSQWAYLITAPAVWRDEITDSCLKASARMEGATASPQVAWLKADPDLYRSLQDYLFLTKEELKGAA